MMRTLYTAATGMVAQQALTDNIANNLANVNTTGFKKNFMNFQDLFYQSIRESGTPIATGTTVPVPLQLGLGTRAVANEKIHTQGNLQQTEHQFDIAVLGQGFFQIELPDGTIGYQRDGAFKIDADGSLVTANGYYLTPRVTVPQGYIRVDVTEDGIVSVKLPNQVDSAEIGQLELVNFINPGGLDAIGNNLFRETTASGQPITGQPGIDGYGKVFQGFLENSNVQIVDEMVNLILAQRAFEVDSKAIQTADEMLSIANNLKR